jgi:hypothetical protein
MNLLKMKIIMKTIRKNLKNKRQSYKIKAPSAMDLILILLQLPRRLKVTVPFQMLIFQMKIMIKLKRKNKK